MSKPSQSKVILITGCSSGFGLLMAARFASKGYVVIATMRNLSKQTELQDVVRKKGGKVDIFELDVIDKISIHRTVEKVIEQYKKIDVLINNAGYGIGGFFEDLSDEEIRAQMETNFFGVQNVTRAVLPHMRRQNFGKIINISSVAGFSTSPAFSAYNASKWALEAFSESLRYELKSFGIDVLLIEPGTYKTKIFYENIRYAKNFDNSLSPYYLLSQKLKKKVLEYVNQCRKNPGQVAALAECLIEAKHPKFRNIPDMESKILFTLRKILPFRIYSWIIQSVF